MKVREWRDGVGRERCARGARPGCLQSSPQRHRPSPNPPPHPSLGLGVPPIAACLPRLAHFRGKFALGRVSEAYSLLITTLWIPMDQSPFLLFLLGPNELYDNLSIKGLLHNSVRDTNGSLQELDTLLFIQWCSNHTETLCVGLPISAFQAALLTADRQITVRSWYEIHVPGVSE